MTATSHTTEAANIQSAEAAAHPTTAKKRRAPRKSKANAVDAAVAKMLTEKSNADATTAREYPSIPRPEECHPDCYGLSMTGKGAGPKMPAGCTVIVEPIPPQARDYAVAYFVDGSTPSVWHMGDTFDPSMLEVSESSTVFQLIEMFMPNSGRRGHMDVRNFAKLHRVHSVFVPLDVKMRRLPSDLPVLTEAPEGCIDHRINDASNYPILRNGDVALVDVAKTKLRDGAVCLLRWDSGSVSVMQTNLRRMGSAGLTWVIDPINRVSIEEAVEDNRQVYVSDGPYTVESLQPHIVGEIVGVRASFRAGRPDGVGLGLPVGALKAAVATPSVEA